MEIRTVIISCQNYFICFFLLDMGSIYYVDLLFKSPGFSEGAVFRLAFSLSDSCFVDLFGSLFALSLNVGVPQGYVLCDGLPSEILS